MTPLDDITIKVLRTLERHRRLSLLQVASSSELSVSKAKAALSELEGRGLVYLSNDSSHKRFVFDEKALDKQLQAI